MVLSRLMCFFRMKTVWLTQKALADLFGAQRPAITKHLKNIFDTKELEFDAVCSILEQTASDGKNYRTQYYISTRLSRQAIASTAIKPRSFVSGLPNT